MKQRHKEPVPMEISLLQCYALAMAESLVACHKITRFLIDQYQTHCLAVFFSSLLETNEKNASGAMILRAEFAPRKNYFRLQSNLEGHELMEERTKEHSTASSSYKFYTKLGLSLNLDVTKSDQSPR